MIGVSSAGVLDHGEETALLLLAVEDEGASEDLVSAVLAIDLGEAEELTVGQGASKSLAKRLKISDLFLAEG